jgi:hypothetical protein
MMPALLDRGYPPPASAIALIELDTTFAVFFAPCSEMCLPRHLSGKKPEDCPALIFTMLKA